MTNAHQVTRDFEQAICDYTSSPYCVALDSCSNAIFLSLIYEQIRGKEISIPCRTYMSVPCAIIQAGGLVRFQEVSGETLTGAYQLRPTSVFDSALRFTADMYIPGSLMCLSFTGPHKHLKLGKGGAILTDDADAYAWFKKARFSGRSECSYHEDNFTVLGWNMYLLPELSSRGLLLMQEFYDRQGRKKHNKDLTLSYPDLSKFSIYKTQVDASGIIEQ